MDIHKPKPWHGVREFLKEYAIIVVGVLTALGAEQAVEWLRWAHKVEDGRAAIREELQSAAYIAEERVAYRDCFEQRLNYLQAQVTSATGEWRPQPWRRQIDTLTDGDAYAASIRNWNTEVWRDLVADGTAVHFPRDEMLGYSRIYHFLDVLGAQNAEEWGQLSRVALLGGALKLSDEARYQTALGLADAKRKNLLMSTGSRQVLGLIQSVGMLPRSARWRDAIAHLQNDAAQCIAMAPERG